MFARGGGRLPVTGAARAGGLQPTHFALADRAAGEARCSAMLGGAAAQNQCITAVLDDGLGLPVPARTGHLRNGLKFQYTPTTVHSPLHTGPACFGMMASLASERWPAFAGIRSQAHPGRNGRAQRAKPASSARKTAAVRSIDVTLRAERECRRQVGDPAIQTPHWLYGHPCEMHPVGVSIRTADRPTLAVGADSAILRFDLHREGEAAL